MVTFIEKLPQLRKNIIVQSLGKGGKCIEIAKWAQKSRLGSKGLIDKKRRFKMQNE